MLVDLGFCRLTLSGTVSGSTTYEIEEPSTSVPDPGDPPRENLHNKLKRVEEGDKSWWKRSAYTLLRRSMWYFRKDMGNSARCTAVARARMYERHRCRHIAKTQRPKQPLPRVFCHELSLKVVPSTAENRGRSPFPTQKRKHDYSRQNGKPFTLPRQRSPTLYLPLLDSLASAFANFPPIFLLPVPDSLRADWPALLLFLELAGFSFAAGLSFV